MKHLTIFVFLIVVFSRQLECLNLPGPRVYVVTPASRAKTEEGRAAPAPFYYHNWMRRMDSNEPSTTTEKVKTPDLIFAEFESGNKMKSIRQLLEKEKIDMKTTTTTPTPIFVPDMDMKNDFHPTVPKDEKSAEKDMTDYFKLYSDMYNGDLAPVYKPSTSTESTTTTTTQTPNVENVWHIIDSQKHDSYSGQWEEQPLPNDETSETSKETSQKDDEKKIEVNDDSNFAYPGFQTNTGMAENESRAIRTEPNLRFPYVNLKPFQMKTQKNPLFNGISNSKKGNNMYTSLDNFYDLKKPVRGEIEDVAPQRPPIDRYNPAQPYLPQPEYGSKSKQSNSPPVKMVASLVPPPPPPIPKVTDGDFPAPSSYESFPPYAPSGPPSQPPAPSAPPASKPSTAIQPPFDSSDDSNYDAPDNDNGPPMDLGYRYKAPSPPVQPFMPTIAPQTKPFPGFSYNKPPVMDSPPDDKPDYQGYHYSKPEAPPSDDAPSYGHDHDHQHDHGHDHDPHAYGPDYPDLIFDKPHGTKGDDMKDVGMMPPPPPQDDMKPDSGPSDDNGFPSDFPGDFKFHHDFDDHDYHHYHHHHPTTTTTTTTEMPRVNRYSYYYLGKKLYYLPLYFSVYFIVYVGALIIKAVLRHKIVYPNSWRPNDTTSSFFSKRSVDSWDLSNEKLQEITGKVTHAIAVAGEKYYNQKKK